MAIINGKKVMFSPKLTVVQGVDEDYVNNTFANALKGTKTGNELTLDDVSPIEHNIVCKVRTKNLIPCPKIEDFSALINAGLTVTDNGDGTFMINGHTDDDIEFTVFEDIDLEVGTTYILSLKNGGPTIPNLYYSDGTYIAQDNEPFVATQSKCKCTTRFGSGYEYMNYIYNPQLEVGSVATDFEPSKPENVTVSVIKEGVTTQYTPNADGTVTGITSAPYMTISTDKEGAVLCVEYNQDTKKALDNAIADIPQTSGEQWRVIRDDTLTEVVSQYDVSTDANGNAISLKKLMIEVYADTTQGVYSTGNILFEFCQNNGGKKWSKILYSSNPLPTTEGKCSYVRFDAEMIGTNIFATTSKQTNTEGFEYSQLANATNISRSQPFPLGKDTINMFRLQCLTALHIGTRIVVWGVDA